MTPAQIIARKRDGHRLTNAEIAAFVAGFAQGTIPDYQMSALAMAIFFQGMDETETSVLTEQMLRSGQSLHWDENGPPKVDKHSTGGIGDKVSLIMAPLLACCGLQVPMISGRSLGPTGGTLDKLESIPGFRTNLSLEEIQWLTEQVGCVITGASDELAPADRKLYALRDVTATVESIPLITASIMSKKLAESLDGLILDVKFGSGAFIKTHASAKQLAQSLVSVGEQMDVKTTALLTDMNQPLGRMIGNAVEVDEAIDVLIGQGPDDVHEIVVSLSNELLLNQKVVSTLAEGRQKIESFLASGVAFEKLREMVAAQGGDLDAKRAVAAKSVVTAPSDGFVVRIATRQLGLAIIELGGGRKVVGDSIDFSVGMEMLVCVGEPVSIGQPLLNVFSDSQSFERVKSMVIDAIEIGEQPCSSQKLIVERIEA